MHFPKLKIDSLSKLKQNEKQILRRIAETPNGGCLFITNPFLLFADIGVVLSAKVHTELLKKEPALFFVSEQAYQAIRRTNSKQLVVRVRGLFSWKDHNHPRRKL